MDKTIRKMNFGKYKGENTLYIIATHIGYIMWCLENLSWFKLNELEQTFYDWEATAIKVNNLQMAFPVDKMYSYVKDQESLKNGITPLRYNPSNGIMYLDKSHELFDVISSAMKSDKPLPTKDCEMKFDRVIDGLTHTALKMIDDMPEDEVNELDKLDLLPPMHLVERYMNNRYGDEEF